MAKKAEQNIKRSSFMCRTRASLFSVFSVSSSSCMILDLGDCETFSADYMEVVRFFLCFRGGFRVWIIAGNYNNTFCITFPLFDHL